MALWEAAFQLVNTKGTIPEKYLYVKASTESYLSHRLLPFDKS